MAHTEGDKRVNKLMPASERYFNSARDLFILFCLQRFQKASWGFEAFVSLRNCLITLIMPLNYFNFGFDLIQHIWEQQIFYINLK